MDVSRVWTVLSLVVAAALASGGCTPEQPTRCQHGACPPTADSGPMIDSTPRVDTAPSCSGCLDGPGGECLPGDSRDACGVDGNICRRCSAGEFCNGRGECSSVPCGPDNCRGCCRDGQCRTGTKDFACGSGGEACANCSDAETCMSGGVCGTCDDGCWGPDGTCLDGTSDEACGSNGDMCSTCADDEVCKDSVCQKKMVDKPCSQTCVGCCSDGMCQQGTSTMACGSNGATCQTCPNGFDCDATGSCSIPGNSRWDVIALGTTIVQSSYSGDTTSKPDPKLEVTVGDSTGTTQVADNTYKVDWNKVIIDGARASEIMSGLTYKLLDDDLTGEDVIVSDCSPSFSSEDFTKSSVAHTCIGGDKPGARAEVRFKFEPK